MGRIGGNMTFWILNAGRSLPKAFVSPGVGRRHLLAAIKRPTFIAYLHGFLTTDQRRGSD